MPIHMCAVAFIVGALFIHAAWYPYNRSTYFDELITFQWWWIPLAIACFAPQWIGRFYWFCTHTLPDFLIARYRRRR